MRIAFAPLLIAFGCTFACNAIVGFNELQKTPLANDGESSSSGKTDDDDGTSSTSSGKVGSSSGTASSSGSTTSSTGGITPACDLTKDFGSAVPLAGGPAAAADFNGNATLTTDELTIVFQRSNGIDNGQILRATRTSTDQDFGTATAISELAQINKDYEPAIRADGLFLFWSEDAGNGRKQLMTASRGAANAAFENPQPFQATTSQTKYDSQPYVTADGSEVYFASDRSGQTLKIYRVTAKTGGGFNSPAEVSELKSGNSTDVHVTLTHDGLTIYFASDRTPNVGGMDIYLATRSTKTSPFANIKAVTPLNTTEDDVPTYVSADHCRLYITRDSQSGGKILVASRPK